MEKQRKVKVTSMWDKSHLGTASLYILNIDILIFDKYNSVGTPEYVLEETKKIEMVMSRLDAHALKVVDKDDILHKEGNPGFVFEGETSKKESTSELGISICDGRYRCLGIIKVEENNINHD